jgi:hypothetical protein
LIKITNDQDRTRPEPDWQGSLDGLKTPCGADQNSVHHSSEVQENSNGPEIQQADQKSKEPKKDIWQNRSLTSMLEQEWKNFLFALSF